MGFKVLVTGAGSGIGRATAHYLAREVRDCELVLVGRRAEPLEEAKAGAKNAAMHIVVTADQQDRHGLREALKSAGMDQWDLAAVIANAGIGGENAYGDNDRWDDIIATNLTGTYNVIQECLPQLVAANRKPAQIVIISSILARLGVPGYSAYCASKAGLLGLTRSLAAEYASRQVLVNAICPGWVNTEMARDGIKQFAENFGISYDEALEKQMAMVPTGRMSEPEEIAALVGLLMNGSQSSMTGQTLDINNGALMP